MSFAVGDDVCVYVPPSKDLKSDVDTGTIKFVKPLSTYDVFRHSFSLIREHHEDHLFKLPYAANGSKQRPENRRVIQYSYKGFREIVTYSIVDGKTVVETQYRTKGGARFPR